ncbi:hypothetical protein ACLB2K_035697 [Fragaria x ananassa]
MMVDKVSRLAVAMAISENGRVSFGAAGAAAFSGHSYIIGRLLSPKKKVEPKAFMATMGSIWGLRNRLTIRPQGERYILRFTEEADRKDMIESGPWFYGKMVFALAEYDGRYDALAILIVSVPVWVKVFGLSPDLLTKKALYMVGSTLRQIITHDNHRLLNGSRARAFPPMRFEFGKGADLIVTMLTFKYKRMCGFCRACGLLEHKADGCQGPPNMSALRVLSCPSRV